MSMVDGLLNTPLHGWHSAHGGRMVEFGGWSMPVQYTSITEEHQAVRERVGLFDIGHMGRLLCEGPDVLPWLEHATTNQVVRLRPRQIQYSLICNGGGGVVDDILVYRAAETSLGIVCNASNRHAVIAEIERVRGPRDVSMTDMTLKSGMIAVQGPKAQETLGRVISAPLGELKYYHFLTTTLFGQNVVVSRTGYTGEDGFEIIVGPEACERLWVALLDAGRDLGIKPCGLGARDTLRFEAAMPLYGHELNEAINPYAAGLGWAVKLEKGEFVGREALNRFKHNPGQLRIGIELQGKRIARQGSEVKREGVPVGLVTSGTFSPTLGRSLAMALVDPASADAGTELMVDVRGRDEAARVVPLPFYKRKSQ